MSDPLYHFPAPEPRPMPPWLARVLAPWLEVPDRLERMESHMATQDQVDQLTRKLTDLRSALDAGDARIQQELDRLRAQDVDVSGLENAIRDLSSEVDEAVNLVPEPAPAPAPGTDPTADPTTDPAVDPGTDPSSTGGDVPDVSA